MLRLTCNRETLTVFFSKHGFCNYVLKCTQWTICCTVCSIRSFLVASLHSCCGIMRNIYFCVVLLRYNMQYNNPIFVTDRTCCNTVSYCFWKAVAWLTVIQMILVRLYLCALCSTYNITVFNYPVLVHGDILRNPCFVTELNVC